jgi:hypothetical protein
MRRALIASQVVLLTFAVATAARAQSYTIGGTTYYPTGSTETMNATFTTADGGISTGNYSGFVRLVVSGSGVSCTPATNDAFYIHVWQSGCGNPNYVPQHDGWYYQLTFGIQTLVALDVSRIATNFIYYDIATGAEVTSRPYVPAYRTDHMYSFIVNTGLTTPGKLHFGVSDGAFGDNSGAYQIQITQLATAFPLTVGGDGAGSGTVTSQAGLTPAINCTLTGTSSSGACSRLYPPGTVVTLTATPATGSTIRRWFGACTVNGPIPDCAVTMSQAQTETVTLDLIPYPLTVSGIGTGSGTVISQAGLTPAIACTITAGTATGSCSQMYPYGTSVTLTATGIGSMFTGWGSLCAGLGPCTVQMLQARAAIASFIVQPTVSGVTPNAGPTSGKTAITITGTGFIPGATSVAVGGTAATSVVATTTSTLTAVTPAGTLGPATVAVTTAGGSGTLAGGFTYVPPAQITAITPSTTPPLLPNVAVTFTATATGGVAPLQYQFHLYDGQSATWSQLQAYSTSNQVTWTPTALGSYRVQVWVRSAASTANYDSYLDTAQFEVAIPPVVVTDLTTPTVFPVAPGVAITWTATAAGGQGTLQYKFYLHNEGTASWTVLQDYGASNQLTWTPSTVGTYSVQVWVRSPGSTAPYDAWRAYGPFDIKLPAVTVSALTTPTTFPVPPGTSVTWMATASGGIAPLQYRFLLYNQGSASWSTLQDYGLSNQVTWVPPAVGTYSLQAWVRSSTSTAPYDAWRAYGPFEIKTTPISIDAITTPAAFPVTPGTSVTWTVSASGGTPPLEYKYWLYHFQGSSWEVLKNWSPDTSVTWTPTTAGTYRLQVWVRSVGSSAVYEAWKNAADAVVEDARAKLTELTSVPPVPVGVGTPVTWTATATGGTAPLQYKFYLYNQGAASWSLLQDYSPANQATWTPQTAGTYWLQAWVRSAGSSAAWEDWIGCEPFSVTDTLTVTTFTTNISPPVTTGTPVTLTATAAGGIAPLQYKFWVRDPDNQWTVVRDYDASNEAIWTPSMAGSYLMQVWVRSAGSTAAWQAWKALGPFTVVTTIPTVTGLTVGPLPLTAGVPATWTATATGGTPPLQYQFWLLDMASGKWSLLRDYAASNQAPWTPAAPGNYIVQVWVRSAGSTASYEAWKGSGIISVQ